MPTNAVALVAFLIATISSGTAAVADEPIEPIEPDQPAEATETTEAAVASVQAGSTAFRPVTPCRLLDTRIDRAQPVSSGETVRVRVTGRCGTPAEASVAVLSLTVTETTGPGYIAAFPAGSARRPASNLNYRANGTVANSAIVLLGDDGAVDIYVHRATELVVDVTGAFVPVSGAVASGRFVPVSPTRLLDTRETGQRGDGTIDVPLPVGVPASATAVVVNVTIVDATRKGFITVYPGGSTPPIASAQNADLVNRTRAVTVIAPVTPAGFRVHRSMVSDLVIDFSGWFTGPSAAVNTDGLFLPEAPNRIRDSRVTFDPLHTGGTDELDFPPAARSSAVVANLTAVDAVAPGYVTAHPAGLPRPTVSNLNPRWRASIANLALMPTSTDSISLYAHRGTHFIVDVVGRFTGDPLPASVDPTPAASVPSNEMPTYGGRVLLISDSAFAGIRWLGQLDMLQGATFRADLESCRRLIGVSCRGREGYAPSTAVDAIRSAPGRYDTLVVTAGYNDYAGTFESAVHSVLAAARAKGVNRIVWLTYRQDVSYVSPYGASWAGTFIANNNSLRAIVASGLAPEIEIADWHDTTIGAPRSWFAADRLHLSAEGARGAATYISRKLAYLGRRPCPSGLGGATTPGGWCADPDDVIQFDLADGQQDL
jgi:hypothetical protein